MVLYFIGLNKLHMKLPHKNDAVAYTHALEPSMLGFLLANAF